MTSLVRAIRNDSGRIGIIGGTGSLGQALCAELSANYPDLNVCVFSRDEHKQAAMKRMYPKVSFMLGDVRNQASVDRFLRIGFAFVFHFAALKHVDILEFEPSECLNTNFEGLRHCAVAAVNTKTPSFVFTSTDKACNPINFYGQSKALSERYLQYLNRIQDVTKFYIFRWGNILGSKGSVVPYFIETLKQGFVNITDPQMTRFWITLEQAVSFMLKSHDYMITHTCSAEKCDCVLIPPFMKSASVIDVARAIAAILKIESFVTNNIGQRAGEKMHEDIYGLHERGRPEMFSSNTCAKYTEVELINILTPIVERLA